MHSYICCLGQNRLKWEKRLGYENHGAAWSSTKQSIFSFSICHLPMAEPSLTDLDTLLNTNLLKTEHLFFHPLPKQRTYFYVRLIDGPAGIFLPPMLWPGIKLTSVQHVLFWRTLIQDALPTELPQPLDHIVMEPGSYRSVSWDGRPEVFAAVPTTNLSVVTTESAQAVIKSLKSSLSQRVKLINTKAKKGTQRYKEIPEKNLKHISKKESGLKKGGEKDK